jgi:hypothetical protein
MAGLVTSSTDRIPIAPPTPASNQVSSPVTSQTTESSDTQDILDISVNGDPNAPSDTNPGYQTYEPSSVKDRFRFDIENGRFGGKGSFSPLTTRFENVAKSTYISRAEIGQRVNAFSGQNSAQSALFVIGYQDASPENTTASSHVDARAQENRRIDQNLDLLNMI